MSSSQPAGTNAVGASPAANSTVGGTAIAGLVGMVAAAFLPWLSFSVDLLGVRSPSFHVNGTDVGSPLSDSIPYGWLMIALAVGILIALGRNSSAAAGIATLAALAAGYAAATAAHHSVPHAITVSGQTLDPSLFRPHVAAAYGVFIELVAALVVLVAVVRRRGPGAEADEPR